MKPSSSNQLINIALAIAFFVTTCVFIFSRYQSNKIKSTSALVDHTQEVIQEIQKVIITSMDLQAGARGYVLTGNENYAVQLSTAEQRITSSLPALQYQVSDHPKQLLLIDSLKQYVAKRIEVSNLMLMLRRTNKTDEAVKLVQSGYEKSLTDKIRTIGAEMEKTENEILYNNKKSNEQSIQNFNYTLYCVLAGTLMLSLLLFYKTKASFKAQKANEEKFRDLLHTAPEAMLITDELGIIKMVNRRAEQLFGYHESDLCGKPSKYLLPETEQLKGIGNDKIEVKDLEMEATRANGSVFPAEISLAPIHTSDGLLISASVKDITQRKKSQQQLELLRKQVDESNDAIFTVDPQNLITSWNYGAEKLFGFTREEAIGQHSLVLLKMNLSEQEQQHIRNTIINEGYWRGEVKRTGKNDVELQVISSITSIRNNNNEIIGFISVSYDISEQKRLQAQVTHLASIVEHSSEAIASRGLDKKIISWNEGAEKMFGYSKSEVVGRKFMDLGIVDITPAELKAMEIELAVKGHWYAEKNYYRKNGDSFTGFVSANVIRNSNGEVESEFFIIKDITLRKNMEEYLKNANRHLEEKVRKRTEDILKTERRFKAMIESSDELLTLMDENNKIIYRSPAASRISGWDNQEITELGSFTKHFHPDDLETLHGYVQQAIQNPGIPVYGPFRMIKKTGECVMMEGVVTNFLHDENIKAIVFNARDISRRKEAEEKLIASEKRYREALDNMLEGIQILDRDMRYLYVNDAVARQANLPREAFPGKLVNELYPGVEQTRLYKNILKSLAEKVSIQLEDEFVFPDGTKKYFQMSLQPFNEGIVIQSVDITDRKLTEDKLMKSLYEKEVLANKLSIIINTLPAKIAIIAKDGIIVDVNDSWKKFGQENGTSCFNYEVGENYITNSDSIKGDTEKQGKAVANGIRAVLNKQLTQFEFQYFCPGQTENKWFRMIVSPLKDKENNGAVIMHMDITELKRLEMERLKVKIQEQRNITRAMLEGQEKERNQIGRELHDNVVQLMAVTKMKLGMFISKQEDKAPLLDQSFDHIKEALTETRNLSHQMVTPRFAASSFKAELERLISDYVNEKRSVNLNICDFAENLVSTPVKETLYRITQEQLNNIYKYSQASKVDIDINTEGSSIKMAITDNGVGFDTNQEKKGIGLTNIYNRAESYAGVANIYSAPGNGCKLLVEIPIANFCAK